MEQVTLSIITVNYNNNIGLIQTLESLKNQTFSSYEHIIIDAASTDGSKETITKYEKETSHLTYWSSEPDRGIYDGMNKGLKHANGEYLYFLNSGDCLIENILQKIPFDGTEYIYGDIDPLSLMNAVTNTFHISLQNMTKMASVRTIKNLNKNVSNGLKTIYQNHFTKLRSSSQSSNYQLSKRLYLFSTRPANFRKEQKELSCFYTK